MSKRKERPAAQRQLDIVRIVELKRAGRTSEEISEVLNGDGREAEACIKPVTVRSQWAAYVKRMAAKRDQDGAKLLEASIQQHQMDRAEALRGFAEFLKTGNPSAPSFLMAAHRAQLALDRLRGVRPAEEGSKPVETGQTFGTIEEARDYLTRAGLGGRVLPYADSRRKKR